MYELFKEAVLASGLDVLNQTLDFTEDDYCRIKSAFLPVASYEQFISKAADGLRSGAGIDRCIKHCVFNHKKETLNQFKSDEVTYYSTILACSDLGKAVACRRDINLSPLGELQYENDLYADSIYQRLMDGLRNNECEYVHTT